MTRWTPGGVSRRGLLAGIAGAVTTAGCIERRASAERPNGDDTSGGPVTGDIGIAGSSTVVPLTEAMRTEFIQAYPEVRVSLQSTGTGGGFGNFGCTGERAINNASRQITESEREQCGDNGFEPLELRVATDALTVIVNNEADWVDCLTVDELAGTWGPDGAQRRSDVRDEWPDERFELYGPASTSGTFDYFTESVVGEAGAHCQNYSPGLVALNGVAIFIRNRYQRDQWITATANTANRIPTALDPTGRPDSRGI